MAVVSGEFQKPTVGRIHGTPVVTNGGSVGVISFVAESHATETGPCFEVVSPSVAGYPVRLSAWPVAGYEPSVGFNLTIEDQFGSSWTVAITAAGDDAFSISIPVLVGTLTISADNFGGASERMKIALFLSAAEPLV